MMMKQRILQICLIGFVAVFVSGCSQTQLAAHYAKKIRNQDQSQGDYKVGKPYQIQGKWYYPEEKFKHVETGIASWYGPGFHGKKTANGETFDMYELTAAHRTLQLPSIVRVTNLENGRAIVVRVNDRGPFAHNRVIDMSKRGAELLGFRDQGTARVKVEVMTRESEAIAAAARQGKDTRVAQAGSVPKKEVAVLKNDARMTSDGRYMPSQAVTQEAVSPTSIYVQAGSFSVYENAEKLQLGLTGLAPVKIEPAMVKGQQFYRVRLGPLQTVEQADTVLAQVFQTGNKNAQIVVD